ncbi:MAG TPA: hypothetical protein VM938_10600 [Acidimicrobiales bacterium]|nr:hypothetical protein [Acidimicrobiales bacterium]
MPGLEELIMAGPPPAAGPRLPIGVPQDYVAVREHTDPVTSMDPSITTTTAIPPSYYTGDEWLPVNLPPEDLARLQRRMVDAGLIPKGAKFQLGTYDEVTRAAFTELLAYANASGLGSRNTIPLDALEQYAAGKQQFPEDTKPLPPLRLPGADEIAQAVKSTVRSMLGGRDPDAEEMAELTGLLAGFSRESAEQERSLLVAQRDAAEGEATSDAVVVEDPVARFKEEMEQRYRPEIERLDNIEEVEVGRNNLLKSIVGMDQLMGAR